mmetsp:Transcript_13293/g.11134  ORF Transcript_13293/g.11134 Transcript_13293/m.11134 type:complete len:146 (-) Transcript_13293:22-459(-)
MPKSRIRPFFGIKFFLKIWSNGAVGNFGILPSLSDVIVSSTKSIFDNLGHMIVPGTIIVMDELFDYPQYADHELKAFFEFLVRRAKERGEGCCQFEWIGTGDVLLEDCFTDPKYESGIYIDPTGAKLVSQDINLLMRCGIKIISI